MISTPRKSRETHIYIKLNRYVTFACLGFRSISLTDFFACVWWECLCNFAALSGYVLLDNHARSNVAAAKRNRPVQRHGNETRAEI